MALRSVQGNVASVVLVLNLAKDLAKRQLERDVTLSMARMQLALRCGGLEALWAAEHERNGAGEHSANLDLLQPQVLRQASKSTSRSPTSGLLEAA